MTIESIIINLSYLGIFLLMISNGFIANPSSQVLYIIAGYFAFTGKLSFALIILFGAIGNTIGNFILYELARRKGLHYLKKFKIFPEKEIRKVQIAFKKRGAWFLFIGKLIPALKIFVPIPAGLAKMNRIKYGIIIFISSAIWASIFTGIGYIFGKSTDVFRVYSVILIIIAAIVIFIFYRYMNSAEVIKEIEK
jgi:membrane protein DedA with SNARE-associated domain